MKTESDGITLSPLDEPEDGVDCMDVCENPREQNRKEHFMEIDDVSDTDEECDIIP